VKKPLDDLVREAKSHLGTIESERVDWSAVDKGLFARIELEQHRERAGFTATGRWPGVVAAAVAAAAVFAVAVHDGRDRPGESLATTASESGELGGRIVGIEPDAVVTIDGKPATAGATIRLGDVIEVRGGGAGAVIERPGKLTLRIEGGSRAAVTHTEGSLVLALARGAVEAQVVPVPSGEAFAVDVDGSRVAVHGTHLRVARSGDRVTVDLNEGVVAVGNAPRVGSVVGSLVTAPAHAEFAALAVTSSLTVSHDLASVKVPVELGGGMRSRPELVQGSPEAPVAAAPAPVAARPAAAHAEVRSSTVVEPAVEQQQQQQQQPARPVTAAAVVGDPNAEQALDHAVKACMDQGPHVENVTVVVSTALHLDLADDGVVRAARFDPPVAPDVNSCAAAVIYKTRFTHGGTTVIPIDVSN
jgi:hypothetical protein